MNPKNIRRTDRLEDLDTFFIGIAKYFSRRSTCKRHAVGAVIVKNKHIISTGYNGAPKHLPHCIDVGCLRDKLGIESGTRNEICWGVHAEQNALLQAQQREDITGATMYCTHKPCAVCTKLIINAGIARVVYNTDYLDDFANQIVSSCESFTVEKYSLDKTPEDAQTGS